MENPKYLHAHGVILARMRSELEFMRECHAIREEVLNFYRNTGIEQGSEEDPLMLLVRYHKQFGQPNPNPSEEISLPGKKGKWVSNTQLGRVVTVALDILDHMKSLDPEAHAKYSKSMSSCVKQEYFSRWEQRKKWKEEYVTP